MDVSQIPFTKHVGIKKKKENILKLDFQSIIQNHIGSIHASAQFALAETQSGLYLQTQFPQYKGKVLALLRDSTVKYRHPANTTITAHASIEDEAKERFITLFEKRGRATLIVTVEIKDQAGIVNMQGQFNWFMQKI